MRNHSERFAAAVRTYLESAFAKRVAAVNEKDKDIQLQDIALWLTGYDATLMNLSAYPACIVLVDGRQLIDPYTTAYNLAIGIGLTADDPVYLERMGRYWEDILEDTIRSDWHLGGACLDTDLHISFNAMCVSNVYGIEASLTCQVDLGGYVYADTEEGSGEVVPVPEVPGVEGAVSGSEGDGLLSALRDDHDAGDEGIGTEEAPVQLGAEEE